MTALTPETLETWANDPDGPVALCLKQKLEPAQGEPRIIYPPTFADIGYNIDTLSDNRTVALIDSVGSQANRMEPVFKKKFAAEGADDKGNWLVPQISIALNSEESRSILDLAHRGADAVVRSCPGLVEQFRTAFAALKKGDAMPLATLAPTSLVFGVWDSRGEGEKRPRLVRALIRAWDVDRLHAAAQFNSVWKALDEPQQEALRKEAKAKKVKLSEKGFADAPATWRTDKVSQYRDGAPNPEARVLGGIVVRGAIEREVTVNLLALRNLKGATEEAGKQVRRYLLGLSLIAATEELELFLREGCQLRYAAADAWQVVPRRGDPTPLDLGPDARKVIFQFTLDNVKSFRDQWPKTTEYRFDLNEAKKLLAKKDEDNPEAG
jgi:CRISPR-associated protein Csb1